MPVSYQIVILRERVQTAVIQPLAVILATPVFVGAILLTRYVSLGSLLGSAAMFPAMVILWLVWSGAIPPAYLVYAAVGPVLIWIAHADNIERLIKGTLFQARHGHYSGYPRATEEGIDFWKTLSAWMAKDV